jgi:ubiquitin-like 1-activating enzyme E1 B
MVNKDRLGAVVFEKDDDEVIHFISSAANLRMFCFGIQQQSFNEVKNMAGNIVPAIASTNSIVSGIEVLEMVKYLRGEKQRMRSYFIQNQHHKILAVKLERPLPGCGVCSEEAIPVTVECNFNQYSLRDLVGFIEEVNGDLAEFSINQGSK